MHIFFCNQCALAYNRFNLIADVFIGRSRVESITIFVEINNPCKLAPAFPVLQKKNLFVFYDCKSVYPASIFSSIHCSFWGLSRSLCIIISIIHTVHFAVFFQCSYISFISLYIYNTVVKVTRHVTYCSRVSILMDLSFGLRSGSLHKQHVTTHLQISVSVCPYTRHNRLLTERLTHLGALVPRWNL